METGSILDRKRSGRPSIDEETVDAVRVAFYRSQKKKSIGVASNELAILRSTVYKVLHKRLRVHTYKLFKILRRMIALTEQLLLRKFFKAPFRVSGKVNKYDVRIWGSKILMSLQKKRQSQA